METNGKNRFASQGVSTAQMMRVSKYKSHKITLFNSMKKNDIAPISLYKMLCFDKADREGKTAFCWGFSSISWLLERNQYSVTRYFALGYVEVVYQVSARLTKLWRCYELRRFRWFSVSFFWRKFKKEPNQRVKFKRTNKVWKFEVKKVKKREQNRSGHNLSPIP